LRDQVTTAEVEFGVGFAGGRVAVGRAADRGFTIVDRHRSLRDKRVDVGSRSVSGGVAARADWLGPALVPTTAVYLPTDVTFDIDDLPAGYSLGEGRASLRPAAFSGYRVTVGSAAANTVFGVMHASDEALSLRGGWLVPLDGQDGGRVAFFTNRKGRFIAEGVSHGRYAVILAGETEPVAEIRIPADQSGLIDVGAVDVGG
jgi:outer membrane usher protein